MSTSSADPGRLQTFVDDVGPGHRRLGETAQRIRTAYDAFANGNVTGGRPGGLDALPKLFESMTANETFLDEIAKALRAADNADGGPVTVPDKTLQARLKAAGVLTKPPYVVVQPTSLLGVPPTSGFVDDPVHALTGNFTHQETDLAFPGRADVLTLQRSYNALAARRASSFGPGWTSLLDVRLTVEPDEALALLPDGAELRFLPDGDVWRPENRPGLTLHSHDEGWLLRDGAGSAWRFDPDGVLLERILAPARLVLTRERGVVVRCTETSSRRTVALAWTDGHVTTATASDGRTVAYHYRDGHLVAVDKPSGAMTYRIENGRIAELLDADGVSLAVNAYDDHGRVARQTSPFGRTSTYAYKPRGATVITDTQGSARNAFHHDRRGNVTGLIDDDQKVARARYDARGRRTAWTDRNGHAWTTSWDDHDRPLQRTGPDGWTETWQWDDAGRILAVTTPTGTTRFGYDDPPIPLPTQRLSVDDHSRTSDTSLGLVRALTAERVPPTLIIDPSGAVTQHEVRDGLIRRVTDPDGVTLTYDYNPDGQLTAVTDADGNTTHVEYDLAGHHTATISPSGARTTTTRDAAGRVIEQRDPTGALWRHTYTPAGRPLATLDPTGAEGHLRYGPHGRAEAVIDPLGAATRLAYDAAGNVTGFTTADHATWTLQHDGQGRVTAVTNPDGARWQRRYDAEGNLTGTTDPHGTARTVDLDAAGRLLALHDPAGAVRVLRDAAGRVLRRERADGTGTTYTYDAVGRVLTVTDPAGGITRYGYSPAGRLTEITTPLGHRTRLDYDRCGRLTHVTDPTGARTEHRYDLDGRLVEIVSPTGLLERRAYDPAGRLIRWAPPGRGTTTYTYDPAGRLIRAQDPTCGTRQWRWDARGQLTDAVDANGATTRYTYTALGQLATVTDPLGGVTTRTYDTAGRLAQIRDQLDRATTFRYDPAGRLTTRRHSAGSEVYWEYDGTGAVAGWTADDLHVRLERDPRGRVRAVDDGRLRTELEWDTLDRLVAKRRSGRALHWRYDPDGRQTAVIHPDDTETRYQHDAAGRLTALHHPLLGTVTYTRDADGRITEVAHPHGRQRRRYLHGLLTEHETEREGQTSTTRIGYDTAGRITETARAHSHRARYSHDPAGQLIDADTDIGSWSWTYDPAGRLTAENGPQGERRFHYDAAHQLARVTSADGESTFEYDDAGRRVHEITPTGARRYIWDGLGHLTQIQHTAGDRADKTLRLQVDGTGELSAVGDTDLLWDPTGTTPLPRLIGDAVVVGRDDPMAIIAPDAGFTWSNNYLPADSAAGRDPWVPPAQASRTGVPALAEHGSLLLDGDLQWLQNRLYHPATRAFLQPDPLDGIPGTPAAAYPYHYAANDPINARDPLGLRPLTDAEFRAAKEAAEGPQWKTIARIAGVPTSLTGALDRLQLGLDLLGLVPGFGEIADGINAGIYLARGDKVNAALSAAAMVPFLGWGATAVKMGRRADDALDAASRAKKALDEAGPAVGQTRRSFGDWLHFGRDRGGETEVRRLPGAWPRYETSVRNDEIPGTWAWRDTAAHEGFHAAVARHAGVITWLGDKSIGGVPVGAPVKYLEETAGYAIGHAAALRLHGIPMAPLEAFKSLDVNGGIAERVTTGATLAAVGLGGGYAAYEATD